MSVKIKSNDPSKILKRKMVAALQDILQHEREHFSFYLQASMVITGYERLFLKPFLEKEMASELEHVKLFGDKIMSMGEFPTIECLPCQIVTSNGRHILEAAIKMEREVLSIYHRVYPFAEEYAEEFKDMSIVLILEENIEHTTADVEEMEKILIGISGEK